MFTDLLTQRTTAQLLCTSQVKIIDLKLNFCYSFHGYRCNPSKMQATLDRRVFSFPSHEPAQVTWDLFVDAFNILQHTCYNYNSFSKEGMFANVCVGICFLPSSRGNRTWLWRVKGSRLSCNACCIQVYLHINIYKWNVLMPVSCVRSLIIRNMSTPVRCFYPINYL